MALKKVSFLVGFGLSAIWILFFALNISATVDNPWSHPLIYLFLFFTCLPIFFTTISIIYFIAYSVSGDKGVIGLSILVSILWIINHLMAASVYSGYGFVLLSIKVFSEYGFTGFLLLGALPIILFWGTVWFIKRFTVNSPGQIAEKNRLSGEKTQTILINKKILYTVTPVYLYSIAYFILRLTHYFVLYCGKWATNGIGIWPHAEQSGIAYFIFLPLIAIEELMTNHVDHFCGLSYDSRLLLYMSFFSILVILTVVILINICNINKRFGCYYSGSRA